MALRSHRLSKLLNLNKRKEGNRMSKVSQDGVVLNLSDSTPNIYCDKKEKAVMVFTSKKGLSLFTKKIEESVDSDLPKDLSKKKNRDAYISAAARVARAKVAIDKFGKELILPWREKTKKVNENLKQMRIEMDSLRDKTRLPVTEWENKEKSRVATHTLFIENIKSFKDAFNKNQSKYSLEDLKARLAELESIKIDGNLEEFELAGIKEKEESLSVLKQLIVNEQKLVDQALELERLKQEEEARRQRELEEEIKRKAIKGERKRLEQERIREEARRLEQERLEREKREAELRRIEAEKQKAIDDALRKEGEARLAIERAKQAEIEAERQRIAQKERARIQAELAEEARLQAKAKAEAEKAEAIEKARQAEIKRQEEEKAKAQAEKEKREANKRHIGKIRREAKEGFMELGFTEKEAIKAVLAIAKNKVPNITINY